MHQFPVGAAVIVCCAMVASVHADPDALRALLKEHRGVEARNLGFGEALEIVGEGLAGLNPVSPGAHDHAPHGHNPHTHRPHTHQPHTHRPHTHAPHDHAPPTFSPSAEPTTSPSARDCGEWIQTACNTHSLWQGAYVRFIRRAQNGTVSYQRSGLVDDEPCYEAFMACKGRLSWLANLAGQVSGSCDAGQCTPDPALGSFGEYLCNPTSREKACGAPAECEARRDAVFGTSVAAGDSGRRLWSRAKTKDMVMAANTVTARQDHAITECPKNSYLGGGRSCDEQIQYELSNPSNNIGYPDDELYTAQRRDKVLNGTFLIEHEDFSCPVYESLGYDCTGCKCTHGFDYGDTPICQPIDAGATGNYYPGYWVHEGMDGKNCDQILADGSIWSEAKWVGGDHGVAEESAHDVLLDSCAIIDEYAFTPGQPRENYAPPRMYGPCYGCRSCIQCATAPFEGPCSDGTMAQCIELWTDHLRSCGCDGSASCDSARWNQWNEWECATKYGQQHFACGEN